MELFRIEGGRPLSGEVNVSGAKNAALPFFAASLLTDEPVTIRNVPDLSDVRFMGEILAYLGVGIERPDPTTWRLHAQNITGRAPYDLVRRMRASICLLGPLVGRLRRAEVSLPGGCVIGPRPIDLHLKGLRKLGAQIEIDGGYIQVEASGLRGNALYLGGRYGSTVLGTANVVMAAVLAPGHTRIESAASEPEVAALCRMLVAMGAKIEGIGSHTLDIEGVDRLSGTEATIPPDRVEAGTLVIAGALMGSDVRVRGADPVWLGALLDKLEEAGVRHSIEPEGVIRVRGGPRRPVDIITLPYPGFPTDLQAQMCSLLALTPGLSIVTERIYAHRFMHVPELLRMGADIAIEGPSAIINGRPRLSGAPVMASDLRASAALVLAALAAEGESWVQRIYHLDRGYEGLEAKLNALGARIERLDEKDAPLSSEVHA